jgi:WD40 repeat protein
VAVTADGQRAVSASSDETLKVWDLDSGRELSTLAGHSFFVTGVAVTPDGQRAASVSQDNTLKVWNLETGACLATFTFDSVAQCCAFS